MDSGENQRNRLAEELEALRRQIAELRSATKEPAPAAASAQDQVSTPGAEPAGDLERIRAEVEAGMGFVPPYFAWAAQAPEVLASLWQQVRACYLDNPIPALTKEKLLARLGRYCPVPYALLAHACRLRRLGMGAGEILSWLERPAPAADEDLDACYALFGSMPHPLPSWPEPGSPLEEGVLLCSMCLYLAPAGSGRCRDELRSLLGGANYARLASFLGYVRTWFSWLEAHTAPGLEPEGALGAELHGLLEEEPRLASFLRAYADPGLTSLARADAPSAPTAIEPLMPLILEQGPFGVAILDPDYRIIKANGALCQLLGYSERELEAMSLPAITHPQDAGNCIHLIDQVLSGARPRARVEKRLLNRAKEVVWAELTASAVRRGDGTPLYSLAFIDDVSERRQAEDRQLGEKQIYERLLHDSQDGIYSFDRDLVCTLWNPAMERIFGIPGAAAVGRIVFEVFPFLTETGEDRHLVDVLRGESVAVQGRRFHFAETGREGCYDAYYSPLFLGGGKVGGGIAFVRDITERKRVEDSLRAAEERYRELFENANDIVYTHDLEGNLTSVNKAAERITGYSRAEALQLNASRLVAPEQLKIACKMIERQVAGDSPAPYELEVVCKDGHRVALEISTHIITRDGKPAGVQGIARDVTERKKTEEALQNAKRNLESWVQELEQRTREMALLSEMGDMLRACLTTEEAYNVIVRVAQQIFPVQAGALYVISPSRNLVEAVAVWGDSSLVERVFSPDECWGLRRGRVHWVEDAGVGLLCKHLHQPPPEGYLCVPMMAQSEALGILYLTQPANDRLTEARQRLAVAMAEHIAMALSNLKLHETLRSQSIRDPLTGLFNRRFMEESLELEIRRASRNRRPLGLIMMEVDNLATVSRALGNDAENSILVELGSVLQTVIRKEDIACRFGADKFAIVLPQGSLEITAQRAESLRGMIKDLEIRHRGRSLGHITISGGIAGFPDQGRTVEALVRAADSALQRAKHEGGDRVLTAQ